MVVGMGWETTSALDNSYGRGVERSADSDDDESRTHTRVQKPEASQGENSKKANSIRDLRYGHFPTNHFLFVGNRHLELTLFGPMFKINKTTSLQGVTCSGIRRALNIAVHRTKI